MSYEIENNVPMPDRRNGKPPKYPLSQLEVGQSFWVPLTDATPESIRTAAANASRRYQGRKFATRTEGNGVRVWRLA